MKIYVHFISGVLLVVACFNSSQAVVVSVDFQTSVDATPSIFANMAGVEANAAAADADFNAANVWNLASLTSHYSVVGSNDTNPAWANLVDSTGVATTASFSITGSVVGTDVVGLGQNSLNADGLFFDGTGQFGPLTSDSLSWEISGLTPGTPFKLYLNQLDVATWLGNPQNRAMKGFIDTNGDGAATEAYQMDFPGVLVTGTVAGDGIIRGTSVRAADGSTSLATEPDWAGWQLSADIPTAPDLLSLKVNTASGRITLINSNDVESFDINYYEILSDDTSLNESGWARLAGRSEDFPAGDGSGNGWEDSGVPDDGFLGEVYLDSTSTIEAGASIDLGIAYNTDVSAEDLVFNYLVGNIVFEGNVIYVSTPEIAGDFDGDGDVDGTDFVAWQTNFPKTSGATLAQGDADGDGDVDGADFVVWQTNFPSSPSAATSPVPEPASLIAFMLGIFAVLVCRRQLGQPASIHA